MTETDLRTLLHTEAAVPDFPPLDLAALTADGDRRVRRRRWAGAAAAAAGVAAAVAVPLALGGGAPRTATPQPAVSFSEARVAWATDSVIHYGDRSIDTGHHVDAFVWTPAGFVFVDDGAVWAIGDGAPERIGTTSARDPHLVVDEETGRVGWTDGSEYHLYDQVGGTQLTSDGTDPDARIYAIDGWTIYRHDSSGVAAQDVKTGQHTVIEADPQGAFDLLDAEDGQLAIRTAHGTWLGPDRDHGVELAGVYGELGDFSPRGTYWATDADDPQVYEVATGRRIEIELPGYVFAAAYGWLDDGHVLMIASKHEKGPAELVTCTVPAGSCTPYGDPLGDFDDLVGHFVLPTGTPITG